MHRRSHPRINRGADGREMIRVELDGIRDCRVSVRRRSEKGEGRLKTIIIVAVIALFIYSAVKIVPAWVNNYQLADKMEEQARFAVVNRYTEEQIRDNIFKVCQDLEIPAKKEDIKVTATNSVVRISMQYTVPVDLLSYHLDLHFAPTSENKALI
ncbi:MAG: DUF4845 domain-containing protein [Acidobacteria bacterium]|nr:DUF4845 domain-containing protein [Acidobacteriota bacterium]